MIAYNHYIKFIDKCVNDERDESRHEGVITIQEKPFPEINKKLKYELKFFNNQGREIVLYTDREFARIQKDQLLAFEVKDVVTFYWFSGTKILNYIPHTYFTETLLKYWTLHIILPIFFTIEETYDFLHAGAVEIEGRPVLFIAETFGGKSTLTDFFIQQGHTMISDDKVGVLEKNDHFIAIPSHPYHRPYRRMEDLGIFVENFAQKAKPILGIFELKKSEPNTKIEIEERHGIEKFKSLRYASEMNIFFFKEKRFKLLTKMANTIPVYQVTIPWDLERLNEVYMQIREHIQQLKW